MINTSETSKPIHHPQATSWSLRRLAILYFAIQAMMGTIWWATILTRPDFARRFFPPNTVATDLKMFFVADVFWFVMGSATVAIAIHQQWKFATAGAWCLVGAIGYAWFCCVGMLFNGGSWLSVVAMLASWMATLCLTVLLDLSRRPSRDSHERMEET